MNKVSRRQFFKMAAALTVTLGWPSTALARVIEGAEELASGQAPLVWLTGQACSGCSVSFLNAAYPDPVRVLTEYVSLAFHPVLSAASGDLAMRTLDRQVEAGDFLLVVEGAVPAGMPAACRVGERSFADLLTTAARRARAVICLGTCASSGGIPAAPPNPSLSVGASKFLADAGVATPLINLPGCPAHPDWLLGTVLHLLKFGPLKLDDLGRPQMFYGTVLHAHCPWYASYEKGHFAKAFGEEGCLFKLGCLGTRTNADCSVRRWNNKTSWCVESGAPCIGCARPEFAQDAGFPFYRIREESEQG